MKIEDENSYLLSLRTNEPLSITNSTSVIIGVLSSIELEVIATLEPMKRPTSLNHTNISSLVPNILTHKLSLGNTVMSLLLSQLLLSNHEELSTSSNNHQLFMLS